MLDNSFNLQNCLALFGINFSTKNTKNLVLDSRVVLTGDVFVAVPGELADGRVYVESAISKGASVVLAQCDEAAEHGLISKIEVDGKPADIIQFHELKNNLALLASHIMGNQARL